MFQGHDESCIAIDLGQLSAALTDSSTLSSSVMAIDMIRQAYA